MTSHKTYSARVQTTALLSMILASAIQAQPSGPQQDRTVLQAERVLVVGGALDSLQHNYFSRSAAKQAAEVIRAKQQAGGYDSVHSANALAKVMSEDLQTAMHDLHVRVLFSAEPIPPKPAARAVPRLVQLTSLRAFHTKRNFGLVSLSRLPGNVGYMDLRAFADTAIAAQAIAGTMEFLANTDALIIDLRNNRGGEPEMQALLASYFFIDLSMS